MDSTQPLTPAEALELALYIHGGVPRWLTVTAPPPVFARALLLALRQDAPRREKGPNE